MSRAPAGAAARESVDAAPTQARADALADGVFAIVMTLLAFDLRVGPVDAAGLGAALRALAPTLAVYLASFLLLGVYWNGHRNQAAFLERGDAVGRWIGLGFLAFVGLVPFVAEVVARAPRSPLALTLYGLDLALIGAMLAWHWSHAWRAGLVRDGTPRWVYVLGLRRSWMAPVLYTAGAAAAWVAWPVALVLFAAVPLLYVVPGLSDPWLKPRARA